MAVTAFFSAGILSIFADNLANTVEVSRNAAGNILINGGAVVISGGTATVANVSSIQAFGLGENDTLTLNESNGALPRAFLFGGTGNDTATGGSGADQLFGQAGNDTILGKGGTDFIFGGDGNDVLTAGDGDDQVFGEGGDDRLIWHPGDDTDLFEGGAGNDTAEVNGGGGAEVFTITANGSRVRFDRVDPAPFSLDIGSTENLVLNANGGDDRISASGNLSPLIKITVDGGAGNDTILSGNGNDLLLGGDGNDTIDGNQGDDVAFMGAGDDVFIWDPGDGSDVVEGQAGTDTMLFNGSAGNEQFDLSANGSRARFFRNLGNIVMDMNDLERVDLNALGGTDTITVNDLSGTDVTEFNINLEGALLSGTGDGQADTVIVNGTNGANIIDILGAGTSVAVVGLPALVTIKNAEVANDQLVINGLGGSDRMNAANLNAGIIKLTIDAGAGDDQIFGSRGADVMLGGDGNDTIDGNQGDDVAFLGAGDDLFIWDPGDGSDVVEGQDGTDTMLFNGANVSERMDLSANGGRLRFFRDVANITMDTDDVERVDVNALGGADTITVNDLSGTDVKTVNLNLAGFFGSQTSDGQLDQVIVGGTAGDDTIAIDDPAQGITVSGLAAVTTITNADSIDQLIINSGAGNDLVDARGLAAGKMQLIINSGAGVDTVLGGEGNDLINGGQGDDIAFLGAGDDVFVWNPGEGSDVVEGQAGTDTMLFNGANVSEQVDISANGNRVIFFRNIANITMDNNDVERIDFNALGGADTITINDLSGTDVTEVNLNLGGSGSPAGDGQIDTTTTKGTNGDDVAVLQGSASGVTVNGLAARVAIAGAETQDILKLELLAGDDVIDASGIATGALKLHLSGGDGDDVIIGSNNGDILEDGAGDDVVIGGTGNDTFIIGLGDNIILDNGGIDTVLSDSNFTLGNAFENLALTGTAANGTGNSKDNQITGNNSNNLLQGLAGNDTLIGVDAIAANPGATERDTLTGGIGNDVFVLGVQNNSRVFYSTAGVNDFALITDFSSGDLIQIKGNLGNYTLRSEAHAGSSSLDTAIYFTANGANELIAVVQDVTGLSPQAFRSVA
ncbi:MAG: calcium-binding protein [Oscillatoriales cyanobacterium C42_A2020_001]|nr:calcium-binding protein [Leptolyngbyaceae cyanobacterium C42_A2020_001]